MAKKYIDAYKLKAKIKQRKANIETYCLQSNHDKRFDVVPEQLSNILSDIDSLQQEQPEVDLEEEVKKYFEGYWPGMKTPEACNHQMVLTPPAIMRMIEHFYELGINARKEE